MKLAGLLMLLAGWAIILAAIALLRAATPRAVFVLASFAVELLGLVLLFRSHCVSREERK